MLVTPWGYTLTALNEYPSLVSVTEFNTATNGKYVGDTRVEPALKAASSAIRNYCGWHVYNSAACSYTGLLGVNPRIQMNATPRGWELLIQLPTTMLTAVTSVKVAGVTCAHVAYEVNGLVRVYKLDHNLLASYAAIEVIYTAGLSDADAGSLKDLVIHKTVHALAVPVGVVSETADGVSVSYASRYTSRTGSTALADDNLSTLEPFKLQGIF